MPPFRTTSKKGTSTKRTQTKGAYVACWVADGDVDTHEETFIPRRETPADFFLLRDASPGTRAKAREGLEEVFDRLTCRAPFIPAYPNLDDAIARAKSLHRMGRGDQKLSLLHLNRPGAKVDYRRLDDYSKKVSYHGAGLQLHPLPTDVRLIFGPFTDANIITEESVPGLTQI
ncbi:hypothetical protein BGZ63DRAFT_394729 [Mariannaea sp. PMI_226]|nr:hypothetical protein BGZ63DRAFT_394729 [Mariannaea sp. PMI_226]